MKCVILCFISFFVAGNCKSLPAFLEVCHRKELDAAKCIRHNMEFLREKLPQGIPELYVPPMDPLVFPEVSMVVGDDFKGVFQNIQIYNMTQFVVDNIETDMEHLSFKATISFPYLKVIANYKIDGKMLGLRLDSSGIFEGNITGASTTFVLHGNTYTRKGKKYVKLQKDKMDLNIVDAQIKFDHLFGDNEELNQQTNKIISENAAELFKEFKPRVIDILTDFVYGITKKVFDKYSYSDVFLDP